MLFNSSKRSVFVNHAKRGIPLTDSGSVNSDSLQNVFDVQA